MLFRSLWQRVRSLAGGRAVGAGPWWRQPLPLAGAGVLIVLVVLVLLLSGRERAPEVASRETPRPARPAVTEPAVPVVSQPAETLAAAVPPAVEPEPGPGPEPEPEPAAPVDAPSVTEPPPVVVAPPGRLVLTSEPAGARVSTRRARQDRWQVRGPTPWQGEAESGSWQLRFELADHEVYTRTVEVVSGRDLAHTARLTEIPRGPGWLRLVVAPHADVYVDGELRHKEAKVAVVQVTSGRAHTVELRRDDLFGSHRFENLQVAAGETLQVSPYRFDMVGLQVASTPTARLLLNGRQLDGFTPLELPHVAVGSHRITAVRPQHRVTGAWLVTREGRMSLTRLADEDGRPVYRLDLRPGQPAKVEFELSPES